MYHQEERSTGRKVGALIPQTFEWQIKLLITSIAKDFNEFQMLYNDVDFAEMYEYSTLQRAL